MLQKTEMSEASTNAEAKVTSFFTSRAREMFKEVKNTDSPGREKHGAQPTTITQPNDLIFLEPQAINSLAWPEIFLFENELRGCIKDNFYEVSGMRGGNRFLPRHSMPNAEIVYFWGERPRKTINFLCIERYIAREKEEDRLALHLNLTKYDPDANTVESSDFHLLCQSRTSNGHDEVWDFRAFEVIENCRKGVIIVRVVGGSGEGHGLHRVMLVELVQRRKQGDSSRQWLRVLNSVELFCDVEFGRQGEQLLKTIKSEFGDIIMVVTSREIYELEMEEVGEGLKMALKPYRISKVITGTKDYLQSEGVIGQGGQERVGAKTEHVVDAEFVTNGLKIMILTNYGQVIFIEGHNFHFAQNIPEVLLASPLADKYALDAFRFTHIHSINGSLAVEFVSATGASLFNWKGEELDTSTKQQVSQGFVLLKPQSNYLVFGKLIAQPFGCKDVLHCRVHEIHGTDDLLIQYIDKRSPHSLKVIKCRTLMTELNAIVRIDSMQYTYPRIVDFPPHKLFHFQLSEPERRYMHCEIPLCSRVCYFLNDKELSCYKLFGDIDAERNSRPMRKLFSHSFFERPVKISVSPLTLHFAIIFKQFVKFFHFNYTTIKNYFTLKIKHVADLQYVNRGSHFLLTCADGQVFLIDAYRFTEERLLETYAEPTECTWIDKKHLLVRSTKNLLTLYQRGWDEDANGGEFNKLYEVRIEDGDLYTATLRHILIFKRNAQIELYSHTPVEVGADWPEAQREICLSLKASHQHLMNRLHCNSFLSQETPSRLLLSQELGFLFVATNRGNVKQYLWPLQPATNPNPPAVFTQQVSCTRLISLALDAKYTYLYAMSESGIIAQLTMRQVIEGQPMPYVYIFNEKTLNSEQQKREFTDRNYFIDSYAPTEGALMQAAHQNIEELEFFIDKLKDDLEEMTKILNINGRANEADVKQATKAAQKDFQKELQQDERTYCSSLHQLRNSLEQQELALENERKKHEEQYQKKLLQIYQESDRLKEILRSQDARLTEEKVGFQKQFFAAQKAYKVEMEEEASRLEKEYRGIEQQRRLADKENEILDRQEETEMQVYKMKIHEQEQAQLRGEDEYKEKMLGENTKRDKAINNLKHRANYFENLILETKVQISELKKDQIQYDRKKNYLKEQLKDKEEIIEKIEKELVVYLKNTDDMRTIKNNHQFQLNLYEQDLNPIKEDFRSVEDNVKQMNRAILKEYNDKVYTSEEIVEKQAHIEDLKQKKKVLTINKLEAMSKLRRFSEHITNLVTHTFEIDLKAELKSITDSSERDNQLQKDEEKERRKKEGEKLLRYKNMVRKEIEQQQKREEHVIKNQHEFYKYHVENTTLVREFNDLKKTQKILTDECNRLAEKLQAARLVRASTPLKRIPSISIHKQEKKLTPFQRYEEQTSINVRKNQDTSDTKLSRNSQSLSFLKGLMKEVNQTDSKYEKMEVMRERVRTFVNPELRNKPEDLKKILFGRTRGTSEFLKLK